MQNLVCSVAMSGGVDSSVALLLARDRFGSVGGITLELSEMGSPEHVGDLKNSSDAARVCEKLGVAHSSLYVYPEFYRRVIRYFTDSFLAGDTPNPCVVCNREIKFGLLADFAAQNGSSYLATGHYARLDEIGSYTYIKRAADLKKDQSYVLAMLSQERLRHACFPLGDMTKDEVRSLAASHGFENAARADSQDICFVPGGDYCSFMENNGIELPEKGNYLDTDGNVLGEHMGHVRYTLGQRRGLGIALGRHMFVLEKRAEKNEIVLGGEDGLYKKTVRLRSLNLPSDPRALDGEVRVAAKLRYAHKPAAAVFTRTDENEGILLFDEAQRAPTPGQFAVMYTTEALSDNDNTASEGLVLGAGIIGGSE